MRTYAPVRKLLKCVNMPGSTFYYRSQGGKRGRKPLREIMHRDGSRYSEEEILELIKGLLCDDFTSSYGYIKITHWLKQRGYIVNKKRIYRIMKQAGLLKRRNHFRKPYKAPQAEEFLMRPKGPYEGLQMDITYVFIQGEDRSALFLVIQDVFSRKVLGYRIGWTMRKSDVIELIDDVLLDLDKIPNKITIRTDRGPQFVAHMLYEYLKEVGIGHELTKPKTPQHNAYIESFFSIFEREVIYKEEFSSIEHLKETAHKFITFYNDERLHAGLKYMSPEMALKSFFNKQQEKGVSLNKNTVQLIGG